MKTQILNFIGTRKFLISAGLFAVMAITLISLRAHAATTANVSGSIHNASHTVVTSASIGTVVHDSALVATSTGPVPTGTVDFNRYANTTCSGTPTVESGIALVNGVAESGGVTLQNTGLSYIVHYNGQTDVYPASDSQCQPLTAVANNVTLSTTLSTTTSIYVGSSVHDSASLGNTTSNAGGTVAYTVYTNNACTANPISLGQGTVTNGIVGNSSSLQFNTAGTYYFRAVYSGDAQNSTATSTCGSEVLTVLATSTPITTGHIIVDKVTNPAGDATSFHFNATGSGYASFDLTDAATPNSQTLTAGTYAISESSVSGWSTTSSVCRVNNGSNVGYTQGSNITLGAGDTITCTFTNTKQGTTTPPAGTGSIGGVIYNDVNKNGLKDAGETQGLPGFTVKLYTATGCSCFATSTVSDANGNYAFNNLAAGNYALKEVKNPGWGSKTKDYNLVVLGDGAHITNIDFGNASGTSNSVKKLLERCKDFFKKAEKKEAKKEVKENNGKHLGQIKNGGGGKGDDR